MSIARCMRATSLRMDRSRQINPVGLKSPTTTVASSVAWVLEQSADLLVVPGRGRRDARRVISIDDDAGRPSRALDIDRDGERTRRVRRAAQRPGVALTDRQRARDDLAARSPSPPPPLKSRLPRRRGHATSPAGAHRPAERLGMPVGSRGGVLRLGTGTSCMPTRRRTPGWRDPPQHVRPNHLPQVIRRDDQPAARSRRARRRGSRTPARPGRATTATIDCRGEVDPRARYCQQRCRGRTTDAGRRSRHRGAPTSRPFLVQLHRHRAEHPLVLRQHQRLVRADDDDQIVAAREVVLHQAERLAEQPPMRLRARRGADLARDAQAEPRVAQVVRQRVDHQRPARLAHLARRRPPRTPRGSAGGGTWERCGGLMRAVA